MFTLRNTLFIVLAAFTLSITQAQDNQNTHKTKNTLLSKTQIQKDESPIDFHRHHRRLSSTYSGFVIELINVERPLPRNDQLFDQFGSVYYDQLDDYRYSYLILANFSTKKAVRNFLAKMVMPRAPQAKVYLYKEGKRKVM